MLHASSAEEKADFDLIGILVNFISHAKNPFSLFERT